MSGAEFIAGAYIFSATGTDHGGLVPVYPSLVPTVVVRLAARKRVWDPRWALS